MHGGVTRPPKPSLPNSEGRVFAPGDTPLMKPSRWRHGKMATRRKPRTKSEAPRLRIVERVVADTYRAVREGTLALVDVPITTMPSSADEEFAAEVARVLASR